MLAANVQRLARDAPGLKIRVLGFDAGRTEISSAVAHARGVLVSGGGNMSADWPGLLEQRVQLMVEAAREGVPVVMGGQTIGPDLTAAQRSSLAESLRSAALVGVRELESADLVRELGVPEERVVLQVDDAFWLDPVAPVQPELLGATATPYLAVTLDPWFASDTSRSALRRITVQIAAFAGERDLAVLLIPHVDPLGQIGDQDGAVARMTHEWLGGAGVRSTLVPVLSGEHAMWVTQRAAAVVSSRYHPLVFATAAGVPCVGLHRDRYTEIKLVGALTHVGMERWTLGAVEAEEGELAVLLAELWRRRHDVRDAMRAARPELERRDANRWQRLLGALELLPVSESELGAGWSRRPDANRGAGETRPARRRDKVGSMLTDEQWDAFSREGYMRLGPLLTPEQVEALGRRADALAMGTVENQHVLMQLDTGGAYEELPGAVKSLGNGTRMYRKIQGLEADDVYWPLVAHPISLEICRRMYGPHAPVSIFRAMVMNKPAGQGTVLPWHQDGGDVWKLDRDPLITVWVALDPATVANGCMEIVPGSHRTGLVTAEGSTLSEENAAIHCPPEKVMPLEVEAGHGVFFHNWLIHRSGVNPSDTPRRAFTACYMDGRTTSTLTGDRFPVIHGAAPEAWKYIREMAYDRNALRQSLAAAEEYAHSLEAELEAARAQFATVEEYARSLEAARG